MIEYVLAECAAHPKCTAQDIAKLIYQAEFGCGHLVSDEESSLRFINEECDSQGENQPLYQPIGGGYARLNLRSCVQADISSTAVNRAFIASARQKSGSASGYFTKLQAVKAACECEELPLNARDIQRQIDRGCAQTHHSDAYRAAYHPAYRVICTRYLPILSIIQRIETHSGRIVVAIDGRCGAGKTTLALLLSEIFGASIVHMDDFFLLPELRTDERLAHPGANVHYERFIDEVLPNLNGDAPFSYRMFDCSCMDYRGSRVIQPSRVIVVEGVYAMRPELRGAYNLSVFADVSQKIQRQRIIEREGSDMWPAFEERYIPLEERYISACCAKEACEMHVELNHE